MNALYTRVLSNSVYQRIIGKDRYILGDHRFFGLFFLDAYMTQKAEHLPAHRSLESIGKCQRDDHDSHTDNRGHDGQPDDKPRKGALLIKCDAVCYKACNLQMK